MDNPLRLIAATYSGSRLTSRRDASLAPGRVGPWMVTVERAPVSDGAQYDIVATAAEAVDQAGIAVAFDVPGWHAGWHLHIPGAVYGGNRFRMLKVPYSPRVLAEDVRPDLDTVISDVSRLERQGPGAIHLLTGDTAAPVVALRDPAGTTWVLRCDQGFAGRDHGLTLRESAAHDRLEVLVAAPGVREVRYCHMDTSTASPDRGISGPAGTTLRLRLTLRRRTTADVPALFAWLNDLRGDLAAHRATPAQLGLSAASDLIAAHYEADAWREDPGYWATDSRPNNPYPWQTGWCGGLIQTRALLFHPDAAVRAHAHRTIDTLMTQGVSPSGLLWGKHTKPLGWCSDFAHDTARPWALRWTLVRRQGDALYYVLRTVAELEARGQTVPAHWLPPLRRMAEVFCDTFAKFGQLGQFLDQYTGEVLVGGSTSAGIVPGALILAWQRFGDARFRTTAEALADHLRPHLTSGVTTGGPGDALQCPDSESVAGLVESFAALHAATGDRRWLAPLTEAAHQGASWVMDADYAYPAGSEFHRLGMPSIGTVFANVQNKHSAPGLCTHSGLGLLALHRATQDPQPLAVLREIAHALPFFVSRADRPIIANNREALKPGWINERVNTSDWDNNVGGVFHGNTWCEVSLLLTWAELPGVYVRTDTGTVTVFDHIEARWEAGRLHLRNPTAFATRVRILAEDAAGAARSFGPAGTGVLPEVDLAPGAEVVWNGKQLPGTAGL